MGLHRAQIVTLAESRLREHGLAGMSMRAVAQDLGVQPGALYHHVASKQELLVAVGEKILSDGAAAISRTDAAQAAADIRAVLLPIRDGAEVISFVHAYRPDALGPFKDLQRALARAFPEVDPQLASEALIRYVLGAVAVEQNHAELVRARILASETAASGNQHTGAFTFGVSALLAGFTAC